MSDNIFNREENLIGKAAVEFLKGKTVAVFGLGGVGSYAVEALARAGIGSLWICDNDVIDITNVNRQLYALHSTVGSYKTKLAKDRILDINPQCKVVEYTTFFNGETKGNFDFEKVDFIVDCIDTVSSKILLVECAKSVNKPIISSLGTGNKLNPSEFFVTDIYKTSVCPLAKVLRRELKKRGVENLKVVTSKEQPRTPFSEDKRTPSSISFVPPVAGMILAGEVIKDLLIEGGFL